MIVSSKQSNFKTVMPTMPLAWQAVGDMSAKLSCKNTAEISSRLGVIEMTVLNGQILKTLNSFNLILPSISFYS